jgi:hypothetical protein
MSRVMRILALGGLVALCVAPAARADFATRIANLDPVFTFGFTDLDASFTTVTGSRMGSFTAVATSLAGGGPWDTAGNVTRVLLPDGTAAFNAGFVNGPDPSNVVVNMDVTGVTGSIANATGSFVITDVSGNTINGTISGLWHRLTGNFGSFDGVIDSVTLSGSTFTGPSGGSFNASFPFPALNGAILVLQTGSWFASSFAGTNTLIEGAVIGVPAPGAAVLGALGLALVSRIRRHCVT